MWTILICIACICLALSNMLTICAFYKLKSQFTDLHSLIVLIINKLGPSDVFEFLDLAEQQGVYYVLKYKLGLAQEGVDFVTPGIDEQE